MKKSYLIFFVVCVNYVIMAQSDTSSALLFWNERQIVLDDFKGIPPEHSSNISEFSYVIGYRPFKKEIDDIQVKWIETYCYMDRYSSWIKSDYKNPTVLLFNQTIFDIIELYTRKLQDEINRTADDDDDLLNKLHLMLEDYSSRAKAKVAELYSETNNGQSRTAVEYWNQKTKKELELQKRELLPEYKLGKWGLGFTFDLGFGVISGNASEYFSNNFAFAFGFDIGYRPFIFYLRGILGFNSLKKEVMIEDKIWTTNLNTEIAIPEFSVGYPVINNDDYSITPFAGIGGVEFSVIEKNDAYNDYHKTAFTAVFGFNFDYKFSKELNLLKDFLFKDKSSWLIRARFTAAPFNLNDEIKGWSFNLTLGIGGFGNSLDL